MLLLAIYALVILSAQSFAGVGDTGIGLANPDNSGDVLNVLGRAVFGSGAIGTVFVKLLLLMVLSSAAASTQTTILPTARTALAMSVYRAIPTTFSKIHKKYLTPTNATIAMGVVSAVLYVLMNYMSGGQVISDSVTSCGVFIALYYGITGFACVKWYRHDGDQERPQPLHAGHHPVHGWRDPVRRPGLERPGLAGTSRPREPATPPGSCRSRRTGTSAACSWSSS